MDLQDNFKIFDEPKPVNTANPLEVQNLQLLNTPTGLKRGKKRKELLELKKKGYYFDCNSWDIRVYEFAEACGKTPAEVITVLFHLGMMVTKMTF